MTAFELFPVPLVNNRKQQSIFFLFCFVFNKQIFFPIRKSNKLQCVYVLNAAAVFFL